MPDAVRRRPARRVALVAAAILTLLGCAWPRDTLAQPKAFLRIETGVHEAAINDAALLPGGVGLVTVSSDKTARVWSLGTIAPIGVLRPPLGEDDGGALFAVAASANAIAVAGRLQNAAGRFGVALYARADLTPAAMIPAFPAAVTALRFSRSGRLLAVGMQGGAGLVVLDLTKGRSVFADRQFRGSVNGLDFDARDRLAASSDAGELRLYGVDGQPAKLPPLPAGAVPWRIAFSPDGEQLAVGERNQPLVRLLDAVKLRFGTELRGAPLRAGGFTAVAYAPDGKTLFAAGSYVDKDGQSYVRRFTLGAKPAATDFPVSRQRVTALLPLDDALIVATSDPAILRLDIEGKPVATVTASHADFRSAGGDALLVSGDGTLIDIPGADGRRLRFDVRARAIMPADARPVSRPFAVASGFAVTQWLDSTSPRLNGQALALDPAETVRSVAVLPGGAAAVLGTDFYVRLAGRVGQIWQEKVEAPVRSVNASADGRLVLAALGDGTVRWYDAGSGRELLSLLVDPATERFVLWTREGFFDHDHRTDGKPDGRTLIGYRLNNAAWDDSSFIEIGQLYPIFFRPDLVGLTLRNDGASQAAVDAQTRQLGGVASALAGGLPPRVTLLEACPLVAGACGAPLVFDPAQRPAGDRVALRVEADSVRLRYRLDDASGTPGPTAIARNEAIISPALTVAAEQPRARVEEAVIRLVRGQNRIRLAPRSRNGAVEASDAGSATLLVERTVPAGRGAGTDNDQIPATSVPLPVDRVLYVLAIGVGDYVEQGVSDALHLNNAAGDAQAIATLLASPSPPVYVRADVVTLIDRQATRPRIEGELRRIAAQARPDDMVLIFFAGHGASYLGKYYFAGGDLGVGAPDAVRRMLHPADAQEREAAPRALFTGSGLSQDTLIPLIQAIPAGNVSLILDTCYSATAATADAVLRRDTNATATDRLGHASGRFVLSSAFRIAADSGEDEMDDHGLFTGFLLRALSGEAADSEGMIDAPGIAKYVKRNVLAYSMAMAQARNDQERIQQPAFHLNTNDFLELRRVAQPRAKPP